MNIIFKEFATSSIFAHIYNFSCGQFWYQKKNQFPIFLDNVLQGINAGGSICLIGGLIKKEIIRFSFSAGGLGLFVSPFFLGGSLLTLEMFRVNKEGRGYTVIKKMHEQFTKVSQIAVLVSHIGFVILGASLLSWVGVALLVDVVAIGHTMVQETKEKELKEAKEYVQKNKQLYPQDPHFVETIPQQIKPYIHLVNIHLECKKWADTDKNNAYNFFQFHELVSLADKNPKLARELNRLVFETEQLSDSKAKYDKLNDYANAHLFEPAKLFKHKENTVKKEIEKARRYFQFCKGDENFKSSEPAKPYYYLISVFNNIKMLGKAQTGLDDDFTILSNNLLINLFERCETQKTLAKELTDLAYTWAKYNQYSKEGKKVLIKEVKKFYFERS